MTNEEKKIEIVEDTNVEDTDVEEKGPVTETKIMPIQTPTETVVECNVDVDIGDKNIEENYATLKAIVESMSVDMDKFNTKKVKACGQRVRSNLLTVKKLCDVLRKQIIADIKEIPVKHRVDKSEVVEEPTEPVEPIVKVRKPRRANRKKVPVPVNTTD